MPSVVGLLPGFVFGSLRTLASTLDPLLAESNQLILIPFLCHNDMRLGLMVRSSLRLINTTKPQLLHFVFDAIWSAHC